MNVIGPWKLPSATSTVRCFWLKLLFQLLTSQHFITLEIFLNGFLNNIFRQSPVISRICLEPVACKLLVEGRLAVTNFVAFYRPETGTVRSQHLVADDDVAVFVQTKLKLGICNDDAVAVCVVSAFLVECDGAVTQFFSILGTFAREVFLEVIDALLIGDVFVVITDLCLGGRGIDGLGKLLALL